MPRAFLGWHWLRVEDLPGQSWRVHITSARGLDPSGMFPVVLMWGHDNRSCATIPSTPAGRQAAPGRRRGIDDDAVIAASCGRVSSRLSRRPVHWEDFPRPAQLPPARISPALQRHPVTSLQPDTSKEKEASVDSARCYEDTERG